ncbi:MFS transporter [Marinactinospora thermotolerans]|uniref:Predicted arabinose efflux permease, MFS family n=1 Tax=Marinactinospora thermotolerans DSM 45154 TaxID=1122192 RepID=A0A1T4KNH1_9ACTN|nr:MFS transporter [Marinactinospora thermotolerans]SJZ43933.1 Predicted arabinose efflux permease, MFS family [Marinactinospora thermotolerans DSM 45154]
MENRPRFAYFIWLTVGYSASSFGTYLNMVALGLYVFHLTGRALDTGLFMALRLIVSVVAGPAVGGLANRVNRRAAMVGADLAQAAALVALFLAPTAARETLVYVLAVVLGLGGTVSNVLLRSSIPAMVGEEQRVRANGYLVTGRSTAMTLGFASAGVVVAFIGYDAAFLITASTFAVSALVLLTVPLRFRAPGGGGDGAPARSSRSGFWTDQRLALAAVSAFPALLFMLAVRGLDAFGSASHNIGIPIFASLEYPENPAWFVSGFWTAWAVGSLSSYRLFGKRIDSSGASGGEKGFVVGTCLMSLFFILSFTGVPLYLLVLIAACAGLADGYTEIAYNTRLQAVAEEQRGAVFGFSSLLEMGGLGVGMIISSLLLEIWAPPLVVGSLHGLAIAAALAFIGFSLFAARGRRQTKTAEKRAGIESGPQE